MQYIETVGSLASEQRLLDLAVARGLLAVSEVPAATASQADRTRDPLQQRWGSRLAQLLAAGRLRREDVEQLAMTLDAAPGAGTAACAPPEPALATASTLDGSSGDEIAARLPDAAALPSFLQKSWNRYQFLRILGRGGMGIVYAARDCTLGRQVALKFLLGMGEEQTRRFQQEARAQARVRHPGICEVYEVGEVQGRAYIAMAYVAGQPLHQTQQQMHMEEKIRILRDVASAVHAAHRLGIVHRDLKPSNVMVQRLEDGAWQPILMDFGLAHDPEADQHLTRTGAVMGTPAYMSPEQAQGDTHNVDRRSDVYSLGAILYELLTGQPPFAGASTLETLLKVVQDDPPAVRLLVPGVPRDLETIAHKCLEKDPGRRYESAQALAHDLHAYLEGEPIAARPCSLASRLRRSARRHRWVVAMCALLVLSLASLAAVTARARVQAARQLRVGQRMAEQAREVEAVMRHGYMSPLHDIKRERLLAMETMAQIEQEMRAAGPLAEAPGHYALGRGYLAMQDYAKALSYLERAQRAGYRAPGLDHALGRALAELYRIEWERMEQIRDPTAKAARRADLERRYRQPAIAHLAAYAQAEGGVASREQEYVAALLAYCRGEDEQALAGARRAFQRVPWLYEAKRLEGDVLMRLGDALTYRMDYRGALAQFEKAGEAYQLAAEFGRSDPLVQLGQVNSWAEQLGCWSLGLGRSPGAQIESVRAAAARALQADPGQIATYRLQLRGYEYLVRYYQSRGQSGPELMEAIRLAEQIRQLHPASSQELAYELSTFYFIKARIEDSRSLDPSDSFDKAESVVNEFLHNERLHPAANGDTINEILVLAAQINLKKAAYAMETGKTPSVFFRRIEDLLDESMKLSKPDINFKLVRTQLLQLKGNYQAKTGRSAVPLYKEAIASAQGGRAMRVPLSFDELLTIYCNLMKYAALGDQEAANTITGVTELTVEMEQSPDPWLKRKNIRHRFYTAIARLALSRHQDPSEPLHKALDALKECRAQPSCTTAPRDEVQIHILRARWALLASRPAPARVDAILQEGQAALAQAMQSEGTRAATYQTGVELRLVQAEWALQKQRPSAAILADGVEMAEQARRIDAQDAETVALEGALHLLRGQAQRDAAARRSAAGAALARLDEALQRNPLLRGPYASLRNEAARLRSGEHVPVPP